MRRKNHLAIISALLILCSTYITSCKNTTSDIGSTFFQSHSSIINIDTVSATVQTVYLDSISTSGTGEILLGNYADTITGKVAVSSYFEIGAPATKSITDPQMVFDSLCLILKPNQYFLGDTSQPFHLTVHTLNTPLQFYPNSDAFYNTSTYSYDPAALATWDGTIMPHLTDSILIKLPAQLGQTFFNALVSSSSDMQNDNSFVNNYLSGLMIDGSNNKAVYGFAAKDSSTYIRMYYHSSADALTPLYNDFQITQTGFQFNHVDADRSGTPFSSLSSTNKVLDSRESNNESVSQPLANLAIRLDIPYLDNLQLLGSYSKILGAQLIIKPVKGTYTYAMPLPPLATLAQTVNYYTIVDSVVNTSGIVQHGNLVEDFAYGDSYYTYDLGPYLTTEIAVTSNDLKTKLLLIPPYPYFNENLQKLVITNQQKSGNPLQLNVQLVLYTVQ